MSKTKLTTMMKKMKRRRRSLRKRMAMLKVCFYAGFTLLPLQNAELRLSANKR
jgi:hypothetical protein